MSPKERPRTVLTHGTEAKSKSNRRLIQNGKDATNMRHNPPNFNDLPLWTAAREAEMRALPRAARKLAQRHDLDPATAQLLASLAGYDDGGR